MNTTTYALHNITNEEELGFNPIEYSRFKFGDKNIARTFGHDLANGLLKEKFFQNIMKLNKQIVVCSSPYQFVPTATFAMKDYFIQVLNEHLVSHNYRPVEEQKIHRTATYKEDYGALSAVERMSLIDSDKFYIDKNFVKDKVIIFMDDIRITGTHEELVKRMILEQELSNYMVFVYFASLNSTTINPNIENKLNYAAVKNLLDLDKIIKNDEFLINTRIVKYILNYPEEEFSTFINYQSDKFRKTLFHSAIGNGYNTIPEYSTNLNYTKHLLKGEL